MSSMFMLFHVQLYLTELNVTMLVISVLRKTFFFTGLCTVLWKTKPFLTSYIGIKRVGSGQVLLIECTWLIISKRENNYNSKCFEFAGLECFNSVKQETIAAAHQSGNDYIVNFKQVCFSTKRKIIHELKHLGQLAVFPVVSSAMN